MSTIGIFGNLDKCKGEDPTDPSNGNKDTVVQLAISLLLGISSLIAFCSVRPKWKGLYAARKRQTEAAMSLPELPDTFFGWIPALWRVTEQEVLAAAGLDAFVFLSFFKMAIRFLTILFFFSVTILAPINSHYVGLPPLFGDRPDDDKNHTSSDSGHKKKRIENPDESYMWAYLVFTYFFTGLAIYFLIKQTRTIIRVRQDYLGSQSTITDRTIKLSGIPPELQSPERIKDILEKLEIGKVESVTMCKNWSEIDHLMDKRASLLRKLEEAWTTHLGKDVISQERRSIFTSQLVAASSDDTADSEDAVENDNLLSNPNTQLGNFDKPRPMTRIRYGFLKLRSRKIDAIDYYEEKLRRLDDEIRDARKADYPTTPLAFVTMDSIPACQMAVQALIDPIPTQLLAVLAPAPSDVVWANTYQPRYKRMLWSWGICILVTFLTIIWLVPVASLSLLLNICTIDKVWPEFGEFLARHEIARALIQTGLPTLIASLLNVAVPFLYDYLSNQQGFISQSDVELSVISKNFAFTFFNLFVVFTVFGTVSKIWGTLQESLTDTTRIAYTIAESLKKLAIFYTNFILLQGVGLFPLRLLQFGSLSLYPIMRMGAKTPRDFAELVQPPIFSYGFYLPTALLVFILCIVYSILPAGFMIVSFGLLYFILGYFTYKYQLLYAMDHPQHATGRAWPMIVYRILFGLVIFQISMIGVIAIKEEFTEAGLIVPLIFLTIWFRYFWGQTYEPLTQFIALRSLRKENDPDINIAGEDVGIDRPPGHIRRQSTTIDEDREKGQKFINPSLIVPLEKIWIGRKQSNNSNGNGSENGNGTPEQGITHESSTSSSVSYGDTHVWRDQRNVEDNV